MRNLRSLPHAFTKLSLAVAITLAATTTTSLAGERPQFTTGVEQLIRAEQELISRDLDTRRIMSPKQNAQDSAYTPEQQQVFDIKTYWIDAQEFHSFFADGTSTTDHELWERNHNGHHQIRFAVHPESESLYAEFLAKAKGVERAENFHATATASSRTLLVWPDGHPEQAFFGKLSLNKEIGGVVRTIPISETARSIGTTNVLNAEKTDLPAGVRYFPEIFGAIPKDMDRGGMIIRAIPPEVATGEERVVPLFSLYAAPKNGQPPLLAEMIRKSGLTAEEFVRTRIVKRFIAQWLHLELDLGITMEPHAQNVLIGLGKDGLPDGNFYHRDFGGFGLDLKHRAKLGRPQPELPFIRSVDKDYHQVSEDKSYDLALPRSLTTFFAAGFLYNLDQKIPEWEKRGWITRGQTSTRWNRFLVQLGMRQPPSTFERMLSEELDLALDRATDGRVRLAEGLQQDTLWLHIQAARAVREQIRRAHSNVAKCARALQAAAGE